MPGLAFHFFEDDLCGSAIRAQEQHAVPFGREQVANRENAALSDVRVLESTPCNFSAVLRLVVL